MKIVKGLLAAMAAGALGMGAAVYAEQSAGQRTPQEIAALDADQVEAAVAENLGVLAVYTAEAHRRHPEIPLLEGVEVPEIDAASKAQIGKFTDDQVLKAMQLLAGEIESLVARHKRLRPAAHASEAAPGPQSTPGPAASTGPGSYCYTMYGKAYSLCASDDRSCKMIAANDQAICQKTGRWP